MSFCGGNGSRGGGEWLRWTGGEWQVEGGWKVYRDGVLMEKKEGGEDWFHHRTHRPTSHCHTDTGKKKKIIYIGISSSTSNTTARRKEHTLWASRAGGCYFNHVAYKICLYTESLCQFALANSFWRKCNRRLIMFTGNVLTDPGCVPSSSCHREEVGLDHQN